MFVIGNTGRGGLRVTTIQAVETVEQLYYWILLWRVAAIRRAENLPFTWARERGHLLREQTLQNFLQDRNISHMLPDVYQLNQNIIPIEPGQRSTEKINPRQLIEMFIEHNLDLTVVNDWFQVPDGLFQPENAHIA